MKSLEKELIITEERNNEMSDFNEEDIFVGYSYELDEFLKITCQNFLLMIIKFTSLK
jgi:hypothetical protein